MRKLRVVVECGAAALVFATMAGCDESTEATAGGLSVGGDAASPLQDAAGDGGADGGGGTDVDASDPDATFTAAEWAALQELAPAQWPAVPPDVTNAYADNDAAAALGQALFYDPSFSGPLLDADNDGSSSTLGVAGQTGRVACAGCHIPKSGFSDTRSFQLQISLGAGWGRRRAPSLLDVGQARLLMWDGKHDALYNQPFGPLETVVEMNTSRLYTAEQIFQNYRSAYEAIFGPMPPLDDTTQFPALSATLTGCQPKTPSSPNPTCDGTFHGYPGDHAEYDGMTADNQTAVTRVVVNMGKALGAFERKLSCGPSGFDVWMNGGAPLSRAAQRGAAVFVGRGQCVSCHSGPFMSDQMFHDVGLTPVTVQQAFIDADDQGAATGIATVLADPLNTLGPFSDGSDGRLPAAVTPAMTGAFRTPMLRCVAMRPTFMHTGQIATLAEAVSFHDTGGDGAGYPGTDELRPLGLSSLDQSDLVAFLEALTGPGADAQYLQAP